MSCSVIIGRQESKIRYAEIIAGQRAVYNCDNQLLKIIKSLRALIRFGTIQLDRLIGSHLCSQGSQKQIEFLIKPGVLYDHTVLLSHIISLPLLSSSQSCERTFGNEDFNWLQI
jgi:hypothetical protein